MEVGARCGMPLRTKSLMEQRLVAYPRIHEGAEVLKGVKYALRSDVMFGRAEPVRIQNGQERSVDATSKFA